jgi:hypothetical protein
MGVLYITNKGTYMHIVEQYYVHTYIYRETKIGTHINDKGTARSNKIFGAVVRHELIKMARQLI